MSLKLEERCTGSIGAGVMIPYGRHVKTDRLLHISEVDRGLACGCVCLSCKADLIARKGEVRLPHFAHSSESECGGACETILHKLAKQIIADRMNVYLPDVTWEHKGSTKVVKPGMLLHIDSVSLEERMGLITPDIVTRKVVKGETRELLIEVAVTHFCGPEKIALIRERRLPCIEIDLSGVDTWDPAVLADLVVKDAPRKWIYNALAEESREQSILDEMRRKNAQARKLASVWQKPFPLQKYGHFQVIIDANLTAAAELDLPGGKSFKKVSKAWQGTIVWLFVIKDNDAGPFRTMDVLDALGKRDDIRKEFEWVSKDVCELARSIDPSFMSAYEAVEEYLKALCGLGLLSRSKSGWCRDERASQEARRLIAEAKKARARKAKMTDELNSVISNAKKSINVAKWMMTVPPDYTVSPHDAIKDGSHEYQKLLAHMGRLLWMVLGSDTIEENLLGLPLDEILSARQEQARQRQAKWEQRQAELEQWEAENKRRAEQVYEERRIAREEEARVLEIAAAKDREKKAQRFRSQILEEATAHKDADWARFWMGAKNSALGNRRPNDVCVDQKGVDATRVVLLSEIRRPRRR
jgi:hypothetical protein